MEASFGVNRRMRAGLAAPAEARDALLELPVHERARERLALVVSELVTNSLRHAGLAAGDPIDMEVAGSDGRMWVSVRDSGQGFDERAVDGHEDPRSFGFGLVIVAALADDWGVELDGDGCTVWCALDRHALAA